MELAEFQSLVNEIDFDLLSDWEQEFLESVESQLQRNQTLTKTQIGKVNQICDSWSDRSCKSALWPKGSLKWE